MSPKRSRSDRLADLGFSSDTVAVMGVLPEIALTMRRGDSRKCLSSRDPDRRGVRIAAIRCGAHDARENGLV